MKKLIQSAFALLFAAVGMVACVSEKVDFGDFDSDHSAGYGYVAFAEGGLTVVTDAEVMRASAVDVNDFTCTIVNAETQAVITTFTYGNRPTMPIELPVGAYELQVSSGEVPQLEWETPVYGATQEFSILPKQTTTLNDVKCKLRNIKVTVGYDADLYDLLQAGSKTDVTIGSNKANFVYTEERAAYFYAPAEENRMTVDMSLTYAGKSTTMSTAIDGVKAGQWRKITINMPHANEGNVTFTITIETLTLDEEITVDVAKIAVLSEEIIPDIPGTNPYAPIISWEGHDLNETFQLMASHFNEDGTCNTPVVIDVDANESTFSSFVVNIASTSSAFMESLASMNFLEEFDLCQVTAASNPNLNTALMMVGIPTGSNVLGKPSISVPLTNLMSIIYSYNGTHTFTMAVTNAEGHMEQASLTILVDKSSEAPDDGSPRVVWLDHDIDQVYKVTADLQVQIEVTAPGKIAEFYVDVISDFMVDENGNMMGMSTLPSHLDLINPGESYETFLATYFPTRDQVKGQTYISGEDFNITNFMPMILMLGETGYANFQLTVVDEAGLKTVKTLQLLVE